MDGSIAITGGSQINLTAFWVVINSPAIKFERHRIGIDGNRSCAIFSNGDF